MTETVTRAKKGDVVLACDHIEADDDLGGHRLFELSGDDEIEAVRESDGAIARINPKWLILCDDCHHSYSDPRDAVVHHFELPRGIESVLRRSDHEN